MALQETDLDRLFELALELKNAGRADDAALLARVMQAAEGYDHVRIDLTDEELDRQLEDAEADIAAGRVTPHEEVMARAGAARRAEATV